MSSFGVLHESLISRGLSACALLLALNACIQPAVGPTQRPGEILDEGTYFDFSTLKTRDSGGTSVTPNPVAGYAEDPTWFCFDNTRAECAGAGSSAGTSPVAIKGLQLMLKRATGDVISMQGGWFVTAEPRVDPSTGSFYYLERQIRVYRNGAFVPALTFSKSECDPTDGKSVGYFPSSNGGISEKMLAGVEAYGDGTVAGAFTMEGVLSGYARVNVYIHAARVWYSVLKTRSRDADTDPFSFYMLPKVSSNDSVSLDNFAATTDFGRYPEDADIESSARAYALPRIGLTENDASSLNQTSWENHVIVGFCLNGTRDEVILEQKRVVHPILFGMKTTTFSPEIKQR